MLIKAVDQRELLIYAFRQALQEEVPEIAVIQNIIKSQWQNLSQFDQNLFQREVAEMDRLSLIKDKEVINSWKDLIYLKNHESKNKNSFDDKLFIKESDQITVLIFAFLYALGRQTYSTKILQDIILENWDQISPENKELIKNKIKQAQVKSQYGLGDKNIDAPGWIKILAL